MGRGAERGGLAEGVSWDVAGMFVVGGVRGSLGGGIDGWGWVLFGCLFV